MAMVTESHIERLAETFIFNNPVFSNIQPTLKQLEFCLSMEHEAALLGGTGRGGTTALVMAAGMFTMIGEYRALLLRRQFTDLVLSGGLLDVCRRLYVPAGAVYHQQERCFIFPSGAQVQLGYCSCDADLDHWKSTQYHYHALDEIQDFPREHYRFFFERNRRTVDCSIPLRVRASGNPGGKYAAWVRDYFVKGEARDRRCILATQADNPNLDQAAYVASLKKLDPVARERALHGDFEIEPAGNMFKRPWFQFADANEVPPGYYVRAWDLAASTRTSSDFSVGAKMTESEGVYYLTDLCRFKGTPKEVQDRMKHTTTMDGVEVQIALEVEPGSAGKLSLDNLQRDTLRGYNVHPQRPIGDKVVRAGPLSSACEAGNVVLVRGPWNDEFIDECLLFPVGQHDDQVDAAALAFNTLAETTGIHEESSMSDSPFGYIEPFETDGSRY
ncbi:MAG: phage terminase large subunit [Actinobacteria bacterium]|nr:phage terminase large subunit [Actinomycetota bacterium]MBU1942895.1 phage terminase large subunit [Actinomycetota bacterium]MBU2687627.1 phage terminase large subunit [Actinomycetota bacterium]